MENKQRISINFTIIVGIFAFVVDMLQTLLDFILIGEVLNRFIDPVMTLLLWVFFRMKGVSFTKTRAFVFFGLAILKLFPVIDAFPLWTLDVVAVCVMTMAEDKIGVLKDLSGTFAKGGAAAATAAMTMAQKNALRRTSSVIMNRVKSINQEMPATADRKRNEKDIETRRQIANAPEQRKLLSGREQQIAAQKQQKQNAN